MVYYKIIKGSVLYFKKDESGVYVLSKDGQWLDLPVLVFNLNEKMEISKEEMEGYLEYIKKPPTFRILDADEEEEE